jgi:hypothetical protein
LEWEDIFLAKTYDVPKLVKELNAAGIVFTSLDSNGIVRGPSETGFIHERPDVAAILAAHDPTPDPPPPTTEERLEAAELMIDLLLDTQQETPVNG